LNFKLQRKDKKVLQIMRTFAKNIFRDCFIQLV